MVMHGLIRAGDQAGLGRLILANPFDTVPLGCAISGRMDAVQRVEIHVRSDMPDTSSLAASIRRRTSAMRIIVPGARPTILRMTGNWPDQKFGVLVPNSIFQSSFPLWLQAKFPVGKIGDKVAVQAVVFEPTRIDLTLMTPTFIEGHIAHANFAHRTLSAAGMGCELSCPDTGQKIVGPGACIECANANGSKFKLCC
jgi:hypothetical protein